MNYLKFSVVTGGLIALMMGVSGAAMAGSDEEQLARMKDPNQWPAPGRDNQLTRHSPLADINTGNVASCRWSGRSRPARCAAMRASPS